MPSPRPERVVRCDPDGIIPGRMLRAMSPESTPEAESSVSPTEMPTPVPMRNKEEG